MSLFSDVFRTFKGKPKSDTSIPPSEAMSETYLAEKKNPANAKTVKRSGKLAIKAHERHLYGQPPSFVDHLPWAEYLEKDGVMLLDDGRSVGAVFEIEHVIGTAGRDEDFLSRARDLITNALQDSFDELDFNPYVVQTYTQDDDDLQDYIVNLRDYISPRAKGSDFTEEYLRTQAKHFSDVAKPEGLFFDNLVTNTPWSGRIRRTRLVVYRYAGKSETNIIETLNAACERLNSSLLTAGLQIKRLDKQAVRRWLLPWFNPNPTEDYAGLTNKEIYNLWSQENESHDGLPFEIFHDFSEDLFYSSPKSKGNRWYFNDMPHEVVVIDKLRRSPVIGHTTGEIVRSKNRINALFDLLPESTIMATTMVVYPQDRLEAHLEKIGNRAVGDNYESAYLKQDCKTVQQYLKDDHKLYQCAIAFYLRGQDEEQLHERVNSLRTALLSNNIEPVKEDAEIAPLSSYLRWLPMAFKPQSDAKKHYYTKFHFVQHLANLMPLFGRDTGTGHPGVTYFNRGGAPFTFDPLNSLDRSQNGHGVLLGPTGAGKSATLIAKMSQLMAVHRPRLFIVEAGNSFGLFADYCERYGLTVNRITLSPDSDVVLPLFADAHRLLDMEIDADKVPDEAEEKESDGDEQRDLLAEMELTARLMITGGETKEDDRLIRADRAAIRRAILMAAHKTKDEGRQTLTADVKDALEELSRSNDIREERRARLAEMAEALELFCTGINGKFFNRPQEMLWQDADVTLVDLAMFAREGYEAELAISYISLINHINSLGEKKQHDDRPIVNVTDEAHIITVNPLLARFLVKASKMWRKLGIWLWLATQNMKDFQADAAKLLSMLEWWELLNLTTQEIEQVNRFRELTRPQRDMLASTRKVHRKYTEGVILTPNMEALFRVVPASIYLALGMTEKEEKAERKQLMEKYRFSELDAAFAVAKRIDEARGIH